MLTPQMLVVTVAANADDEVEEAAEGGENGKVGLVDDFIPEVVVDDVLGPASGVDTVVFFPKNPTKCKWQELG